MDSLLLFGFSSPSVPTFSGREFLHLPFLRGDIFVSFSLEAAVSVACVLPGRLMAVSDPLGLYLAQPPLRSFGWPLQFFISFRYRRWMTHRKTPPPGAGWEYVYSLVSHRMG